MTTDHDTSTGTVQAVTKGDADGVTPPERYLKTLGIRSFLPLWSYMNLYRDQRAGKTGDGKELCDMLVVFEDHVIIFSDKYCECPNTGNTDLDWSRWYKRTVQKSAEQLWGAERWIKAFPNRVFLDRACTKPFPIELPDPARAKFHRIVIAHGISRRCIEVFGGGSGSLMVDSTIVGDMHLAKTSDGGRTFAIGQVDPSRG
jgi:hypothetical protein